MDKKQLIRDIISDCRLYYKDADKFYGTDTYIHLTILERILEHELKDVIIDKIYDYTKCAVCNTDTLDGSVLCDSCKADSQKDYNDKFDPSLGEFIKVKK